LPSRRPPSLDPDRPGQICWRRRGVIAFAVVAPLAGCALPKTPALPRWARSASRVADYPAVLPPAAPARATQQFLVAYLDALAPLAERGALVFDDAGIARLAAGNPPAEQLAALLAAARDANARPLPAMIGPTMPQIPDDYRLETVLREGDPAFQQFIEQFATAIGPQLDDPAQLAAARADYRAALHQIAEGHALLRARARHLDQEETRRMMRRQEAELLRIAARLPTVTPIGTPMPPRG
jgi:hypothetical protein